MLAMYVSNHRGRFHVYISRCFVGVPIFRFFGNNFSPERRTHFVGRFAIAVQQMHPLDTLKFLGN